MSLDALHAAGPFVPSRTAMLLACSHLWVHSRGGRNLVDRVGACGRLSGVRVEPADVWCDGCPVVFPSDQVLSAAMVGGLTSLGCCR